MGRIKWRVEAALVRLLFRMSGGLGIARASQLGGSVAQAIGPRLPVSRIGRRNLELAFPHQTSAWREATLRQCWNNLGRTMLEIPHIATLRRGGGETGWEIEGLQHLPADGRAILVSGHLANWELLRSAAGEVGFPIGGFYRAPDNPLVDTYIRQMRSEGADMPLFPKGSAGSRQALKHLSQGGALALLVDQKLNEGLEVPFFGHPAMTTSSPAELALRYDYPIIPAQIRRTGACQFRITLEAPLERPQTGDKREDIRQLTIAINQRLEAWIREQPGDWLWLHRRFPKSFYKAPA